MEILNKLNKKHLVVTIVIIFAIILSACSLHTALSSSNNNTTTVTKEKKQVVKKDNVVSLVATGDNVIHENVYTYADKSKGTLGDGQYDFSGCYKNITKYIKGNDIKYCCQETILGGDNLGIRGYPSFNSPSVIASNLNDAGFNVVSGGTNHSMDESTQGVLNNNATWAKQKDVKYVGTYSSNEDKNNIRIIDKNGIKIAILAYTFGVNQYTNYRRIEAEMNAAPYLVPVLDDAVVTSDVQAAKQISDCVIVAVHWGRDTSSDIIPNQQHFADLFTNLGVDLVLGSHSHMVQPIETKTNQEGHKTTIVYGMGNMISSMKEVDTQLGLMVKLDIVKNKDKSISIKNLVAIPLVNHYEDSNVCTVYRLKDYTKALASRHSVLKNQPDCKKYFKDKINSLISKDIKKDM